MLTSLCRACAAGRKFPKFTMVAVFSLMKRTCLGGNLAGDCTGVLSAGVLQAGDTMAQLAAADAAAAARAAAAAAEAEPLINRLRELGQQRAAARPPPSS